MIDQCVQGVNRLFVLSFENATDRTAHADHYFREKGIKDQNLKIDGKNLFDQPIKI